MYSDPDFITHRQNARIGSQRLRNAILRSLGHTPPRSRPAAVLLPIKRRGRPPHAVNKRPDRTQDIQAVIACVGEVCRVSPRTMRINKRRFHKFVRPRQIAMYALRQKLRLSYPEIGKAFGGMDHTTAMHGCQIVERLVEAGDETAIRALNAVQVRLPQ